MKDQLNKAIDLLKGVLCGQEDKCEIQGSDEDRAVVDEALAALSELGAMVGSVGPVARLYVTETDTYPDIDVEVINGTWLQPEMSPISVYVAAPPAQQPQIVGEVLPRWDTEKERVDGVRAHMHKELPIDTKLYAYLPAESKPLFPSGAPEAIEKARNLGMDLS